MQSAADNLLKQIKTQLELRGSVAINKGQEWKRLQSRCRIQYTHRMYLDMSEASDGELFQSYVEHLPVLNQVLKI